MLNFSVGVNFVHVKTANERRNKIYIQCLTLVKGLIFVHV